MPEKVILSIRYQGVEKDFELPSGPAIQVYEDSLRNAIRDHFPSIAMQNRKIWLRYQGVRLDFQAFLEAYGIYDGSILELEIE